MFLQFFQYKISFFLLGFEDDHFHPINTNHCKRFPSVIYNFIIFEVNSKPNFQTYRIINLITQFLTLQKIIYQYYFHR